MKRIGYWRGLGEDPRLPDPRTMVDPTWPSSVRAVVVAYLRSAPEVEWQKGISPCRICGCGNGHAEQSDGVYRWPSGFAHYVADHGVRPPAAFVAHILGSRAMSIGAAPLPAEDTQVLQMERVRAAGECPICGNFGWMLTTMAPAFDMASGHWHHPSCRIVRAVPTR